MRMLTNEGQPVICLHHLAQPPMLHRGHGQDAVETLGEPLKHVVGVLFLPGLDIFSAEDDIVMIRVGIHPEIVIRVAGIPPQPFRHGPFRHARAQHVAGIEGEFTLEERCRYRTCRAH